LVFFASEVPGLGYHRLDLFSREFGDDVPPAGLWPHQEPKHERAILLEEEDICRRLLVDVAANDAERLLIVARLAPVTARCGLWRLAWPSSMKRAMSSSRNVNVSLLCMPTCSDQAPVAESSTTIPWTTKPSGASTTMTSRMPR